MAVSFGGVVAKQVANSNVLTLPPAQYVGACAVYPFSDSLHAAFARQDRFGNPYNAAVRDGNHLLVPRGFAPEPTPATDKRKRFELLSAINCKMPPRNQDQANCINKSVALLTLDHKNHILEGPTGWGKTYVGSAIAARVCQPTLIIVTKNDLLKEWKKTLIHLIGVPESQIGHVQQDTCDYKGKRFVIGMVHSLVIPGRYEPEFYNAFGMVVFDEVHLMGADTFVRACQLFPAFYRLGLSATPDRSDGKMNLVKAHIGPILVKGTLVPMIPKVLVKKTGWRIPLASNGKPIPHQPGKMMHITKIMAKSKQRNQIIVDFVLAAYKKGRRCLIVSDLTDHLSTLHLMLGAAGIPGEKIDYYVGGKEQMELEIAAQKPVILATKKMVEYGTNQPQWDTLVLACPWAKVKQIIGRIIRQLDDKLEPVALDLVDVDPVYQRSYLSREKEYYDLKAKIVKM